MSDAYFWALTFREFHALCDRKQDQEKHEYYRTGIICSTIYNIAIAKAGKEDFTEPEDFMPGGRPEPEPMTDEQMIAFMRALNNQFGGDEDRHKLTSIARK